MMPRLISVYKDMLQGVSTDFCARVRNKLLYYFTSVLELLCPAGKTICQSSQVGSRRP